MFEEKSAKRKPAAKEEIFLKEWGACNCPYTLIARPATPEMKGEEPIGSAAADFAVAAEGPDLAAAICGRLHP
jgi:hypothetical protein